MKILATVLTVLLSISVSCCTKKTQEIDILNNNVYETEKSGTLTNREIAIAQDKKNSFGSERFITCLNSEIRDPIPHCIYTDTIIEEIKNAFNGPIPNNCENSTREMYLACRNKNSEVCFDTALWYAYVWKHGLIHLSFNKIKEQKNNRLESTKFQNTWFIGGLVHNIYAFYKKYTDYYKYKKISYEGLENNLNEILKKCNVYDIRLLERIKNYFKKRAKKRNGFMYVDIKDFVNVFDKLTGYYHALMICEGLKEKHNLGTEYIPEIENLIIEQHKKINELINE